MFGNPHERAPQAYVDALVRGAQPTGKDHYAYTQDLPEATTAIAAGLRGPARTAVRRGRHPHDERQLRRVGRRSADGRGRRRRGDLRLAAVVLLRDIDRRRGRDAGAGVRGSRAFLRSGPRGDRGGDHAAHARHHRELAAQPVGADLRAGAAHRARHTARDGVGAQRPADLPAVRRGVQPHRVRRAHVHDPGRLLPALVPALHVCEDAAVAGLATGLHRDAARHARGRGASPGRCRSARSRTGGPIRCRCCSTPCPTSTR